MDKISDFFETLGNVINLYAPYLLFVFTIAALAAILIPYFMGPEYHAWYLGAIR